MTRVALYTWTDEAVEILRAQWPNPNIDAPDVAQMIGVPTQACVRKAYLLGIGVKARPAPKIVAPALDKDQKQRAIAMYLEGHSAGSIAVEFGVSRSTISGLIHREKLPLRGDARSSVAIRFVSAPGQGKPKKPRVKREPKPRVKKAPRGFTFGGPNQERREPYTPIALHVVPPTAKPWLEREFCECAFPVCGEGADTFSCCGPVVKGAYCAGHFALMHAPSDPRKASSEPSIIRRRA